MNILILYYICSLICPKNGRFPTIYSYINRPFFFLSGKFFLRYYLFSLLGS